MATREEYVEKVRKLLAKAESTTVQAEADAFFAKAAELITQWRIEEAELAATGPRDETPTKTSVHLGTYTPKVDCLAMATIMEALGVKVAFQAYGGPGRPPAAWLYGFAGDVEKALLLWTSVSFQLAGACRVAEGNTTTRNRNDVRVFRQSFKLGYAQRVGKRLGEAKTAAAAAYTGGQGLVLLANRAAVVHAFMREEVSPGRRSAIKVDARAKNSGWTAGGAADLGGSRLGGQTKGALS